MALLLRNNRSMALSQVVHEFGIYFHFHALPLPGYKRKTFGHYTSYSPALSPVLQQRIMQLRASRHIRIVVFG